MLALSRWIVSIFVLVSSFSFSVLANERLLNQSWVPLWECNVKASNAFSDIPDTADFPLRARDAQNLFKTQFSTLKISTPTPNVRGDVAQPIVLLPGGLVQLSSWTVVEADAQSSFQIFAVVDELKLVIGSPRPGTRQAEGALSFNGLLSPAIEVRDLTGPRMNMDCHFVIR